ncbi:MAG: hypothetical protein ACI870_000479 [Crocinitomicaceae bacterium]|jgi:hypothetical protein
MKKIFKKINTKTMRSIITGLLLAGIFTAGSALVQAKGTGYYSSARVAPFIPNATSLVSKIGSLSVGSTSIPVWFSEVGFCNTADYTSFADQTCLQVIGQAVFSNVLVQQITSTGFFVSGDPAIESPSEGIEAQANFIVKNQGTQSGILVGGLKYSTSGGFTPRDLTTQRGVCADATGKLVICTGSGTVVVNGSCGSANGGSTPNAPTTGLCNTGTPSNVTDNTSSSETPPPDYTWNCIGSGGGSTSSCSSSQSTTYNWEIGNWGACTDGSNGSCSGSWQTTSTYGCTGGVGPQGYVSDPDNKGQGQTIYCNVDPSWDEPAYCGGLYYYEACKKQMDEGQCAWSGPRCAIDFTTESQCNANNNQNGSCLWRNATTTTNQCSGPTSPSSCIAQNGACSWNDETQGSQKRSVLCKDNNGDPADANLCPDPDPLKIQSCTAPGGGGSPNYVGCDQPCEGTTGNTCDASTSNGPADHILECRASGNPYVCAWRNNSGETPLWANC